MIKNPNKPFSVAQFPINTFVDLGAAKGKTQILFLRNATKNDVTLDMDSTLSYGSNCNCYPILSATGNVIGSLLIAHTKYINILPTHLVILKSDEDNFSACQVEGVGGLLTFIDSGDNALIIPYEPNLNKLTVVDRGQTE